jgi:eukaryotic-like serine/threonine-protein kinase
MEPKLGRWPKVDEQGWCLGERNQLETLIARGGMGEVYRGTDRHTGQTVAIKMSHPDLAQDPTLHARFRHEIQIHTALDHPSILKASDSGQEILGDGVRVPYLLMERLDGPSLHQRLDAGKCLVSG